MKVQFNTDKNIDGATKHQNHFSSQIADELDIYQSHITRIEAHLSDGHGNKEGMKDVKCLLEARLEGRKPIAVNHHAHTVEKAVSGALDKLKNSLKTIFGRIQNH
jgi:hypothetical protein